MGCSGSKPVEPTNTKLPAAPKRTEQAPAASPAPAPAEPAPPAQEAAPAPAPAPAPVSTEPAVPQASGQRTEVQDSFKLLLCGAGESGKTTFTRQLKLRYLGGFLEEEKTEFVNTIRGNVIQTMQMLLNWLEKEEIELPEDYEDDKDAIIDLDAFECEFDETVVEQLKHLWESEEVQNAFQHRNETDIPDQMDYFFAKLDELADEEYVPTDDDVLKARIRTIGYEDVTLELDGAYITIYDVGGQKNERSKWANIMNTVDGAIVCAAIADFDKPMFEDKEVMRINDALQIFHQITHFENYQESPIFLLCNKYDLFAQKVRETDKFHEVFPEYTGDIHNPDECVKWLMNKFIEQSLPEVEDRPIKTFIITALNSNDVIEATDSICKFISEQYYA